MQLLKIFILIFTLAFCQLSLAADHATQCIQKAIKRLDNHYQLLINKCGLEDGDLPTVIDYLKSHPYLKYIDISDNKITDQGVKLLMTVPINELYLDGNKITDAGAKELVYYTGFHLSLTDSNITSDGAAELAKNTSIRWLEIGGNPIGDSGATAFINNQTLESLFLDKTNITAQAVIDLMQNKKLQVLELSRNPLGDKAASALAENPRLTAIYLEETGLTDAGAKAFLTRTAPLDTLSLWKDDISDQMIQQLRENHAIKGLII